MEQSKQRAWEKAQQVAVTLSKQVQEKLITATAEEAAHAREVSVLFLLLCTSVILRLSRDSPHLQIP